MMIRNITRSGIFILPVVLIFIFPLSMSATWNLQAVQSPHSFSYMGPRSQVLDTDGNPHIAYGEDNLYHAWFDGTQWKTEIVDSAPQTGRFSVLRMSGNDELHICYLDDFNLAIKYAHWYHGVWAIHTVTTGLTIATPFAMGIDANGLPWIAFLDLLSHSLYISHRTSGSQWVNETVATIPDMFNGIAMEFHGNLPRIAYSHGPSGESVVHFAYHDGSQWHTQPLDTSGDNGNYLDMVVSNADDVHICYMDLVSASLKYITFTPGGWPGVPWVVDDEGNVGYYSSIRLDNTGRPVIGYLDLTNLHRIRYARYNGAIWTIGSLNLLGKPGLHLSITLNATGTPLFSYYDADDFALQFTHPSSSGWETDIVDSKGDVGMFHSLCLNNAGDAVLPFQDPLRGGVYVSRYDGTDWTTTTVDTNLESGMRLSAAMDSQFNMGLCYPVFAPGILVGEMHYVSESHGTWSHSVIDDTEVTGYPGDIAFDRFDRPHTCYYDGNHTLLKYAVQDNGVWLLETIVPEHVYSVSMALDDLDRPHVCFQGMAEQLRYATKSGTGWNIATLDPGSDTGYYAQIALDRSGYPHIVSYDKTSSEIRYRKWNGASWTSTLVATAAMSSSALSLALDASDSPCVLYQDNSQPTLMYASLDKGLWRSIEISGGPIRALNCKLRIDQLNHVTISYYDRLIQDLFVGTRRSDIWYDLSLSDHTFQNGESFLLNRSIHNSFSNTVTVVEYIILDVYGQYWFAPSWTQTAESVTQTAFPSSTRTNTILDFTWPQIDGSAGGIRIWGGIVMFETSDLLDYDLVEFGWS